MEQRKGPMEEAIKLREFPEIVFTDGPTGRRASFRDGLDVWEVIEPYLLAGKDWSVLRQSYPDVDEGKLRAAVRLWQRQSFSQPGASVWASAAAPS